MTSNARALMNYSFLVVFANDNTVDAGELAMLERIALEDYVVDEEEKAVLRNIFSRIDTDTIDEAIREEITRFCTEYNI